MNTVVNSMVYKFAQRWLGLMAALCITACMVVRCSSSSTSSENEVVEGGMPEERRDWIGEWVVEDCQDGCNTRFGIPVPAFILDDEKPEECLLHFEEDHMVIRSKRSGDINGQWFTDGNVMTLTNAFGFGKTLIGGYNFLGRGNGLSFRAEFDADLSRAKKVGNVSAQSEADLLEYGPSGYQVGQGILVGRSADALNLSQLSAQGDRYDVYNIPAQKVSYSFTLRRYDREVKMNIPVNHLDSSTNFFSGCE
ncbi:MAG TPA: hypothetical protein DCF84_02455 [Bacteroidetes bacterium]|nr:hypothetical protein [Bacteroidota bacterium]